MNPTLSHAVTFADRFGLKHLAFEVGETVKDRQSKLVNIIRSMGSLQDKELGQPDLNPISRLSLLLESPAESAAQNLAFAVRWVLPDSNPIWEVVIQFRDQSAFVYVIHNRIDDIFTMIANVEVINSFSPLRIDWHCDDQLIVDALNGVLNSIDYCFASYTAPKRCVHKYWFNVFQNGTLPECWVESSEWIKFFDDWREDLSKRSSWMPGL